MAISRRLRFEILRRDNYTCRYCGATSPDVTLTVDHVRPITLGGTDLPDNLVTACTDCNAGKTSIDPDSPTVQNVANDALRWARAIEAVMDTYREQRVEMDGTLNFFNHRWERWGWGEGDERITMPRPSDWRDSVERFLSLGLHIDILCHYIEVAMRKQGVPSAERWNYFCGCCWRTLDDAQAKAKGVIAFEEEWRKSLGIT